MDSEHDGDRAVLLLSGALALDTSTRASIRGIMTEVGLVIVEEKLYTDSRDVFLADGSM